MAHSSRKIHKKRGTRTCGYGGAQKHRGSGSRGGVGKGGSKKQKWSYISKNFPGYFGRRGFKRPEKVSIEVSTINVKDLEERFESLLKNGRIEKGEDGLYHLDLKALGYNKLLGSGNITRPLALSVESYTERALKKIEEAGGKIESGVPEAGN